LTLRQRVLTGRIVRRALDGSDFALAGNATLELCPYFVGRSFFQRVGAAGRKKD
jgi:hypothetical protein